MSSVSEMLKSQADFPILLSTFSAKATGWKQKVHEQP